MTSAPCCILSKFYIKPQLSDQSVINHGVVSYRNSTSNHNLHASTSSQMKLYLIEILHQTTTVNLDTTKRSCCILSKFYIKPQRGADGRFIKESCILSKFYIKPQRRIFGLLSILVVSYRNSTSNHNPFCRCRDPTPVVSYRNSTSNHNPGREQLRNQFVVSYRNSTSNHNQNGCNNSRLNVVSYRNSTSNHNFLDSIKL